MTDRLIGPRRLYHPDGTVTLVWSDPIEPLYEDFVSAESCPVWTAEMDRVWREDPATRGRPIVEPVSKPKPHPDPQTALNLAGEATPPTEPVAVKPAKTKKMKPKEETGGLF